MSSWELGGADTWMGRPVAHRVADADRAHRVVVTGRIVTAGRYGDEREPRWVCDLDDGTGHLQLVFLGRREVPGLVAGARVSVEGTARLDDDRLAVWNPWYRLEA